MQAENHHVDSPQFFLKDTHENLDLQVRRICGVYISPEEFLAAAIFKTRADNSMNTHKSWVASCEVIFSVPKVLGFRKLGV